MKQLLASIFTLLFFTSCDHATGPIEAAHDNWNYESISGSKGNVFTTRAGAPKIYDSATIVYSEADASTMLIKTKEGEYVYIQGPAVIEFFKFNADSFL